MQVTSSQPVQALRALWQQLFKSLPYHPTDNSSDGSGHPGGLMWSLLLAAFQVLRTAVRRTLHSPGFSTITIAVLAVGIGANTTVFLLLDAVLLKPLPYVAPDKLVHVTARERAQSNLPGCLSYAHFASLRQPSAALAAVAGYTNEGFTLTGRGSAIRLEAARTSANFFNVLSVRPIIGRSFLPAEDTTGRDQVVMISERLWRQRFDADPGVIGRKINLDLKAYTVVGVLPEQFQFDLLGTRTDIWAPSLTNLSALTPQQVEAGACYLNAIARLAPGSSISGAQAVFALRQAEFLRQYAGSGDADPKRTLEVVPLSEKLIGEYRAMFLMLAGTVFLFLMIACANVAGLSLARAVDRRKEVALRIALGATRLHVIAQLTTESLLLAVVGGVIGTGLSLGTERLSSGFVSGFIPHLHSLGTGFSWRVVLFSAALSALTGVLCGLAPALQFADSNLSGTLREAGRGTIGGRWRNLSRSILAIGQIAISVVLLVGAAVLGHSFARLRNQPLGFRAENLLTMNVSLSQSRYASAAQITNFYSDALSRICKLPGVRTAAISSALPVNESRLAHILSEGQPNVPLARRALAALQSLDPSYLQTMGISLKRGRFFRQSDNEHGPRVAVVNEAFAASFFPHHNPLGKRVWMGKLPESWQVVGVIGDIKNVSLASPTQPELDIPFGQLPWPQMNLLIRAGDGSALALANEVRREINQKDPEQPLTNVATIEDLLADSRSQPRLMTSVLLVFAALAFSIAIVGVYSVISYQATQRMPEFGVRVALGATRWNLIANILKQGAMIAGTGVAIGLTIAFVLARTASSLIYGVSQFDPLSFGVAPALLFAVALLAALHPALRVTRLRPADVLRAE